MVVMFEADPDAVVPTHVGVKEASYEYRLSKAVFDCKYGFRSLRRAAAEWRVSASAIYRALHLEKGPRADQGEAGHPGNVNGEQ